MARDRLELQLKLVEVLGSKNVYFEPPASVQLKYPCIIYSRSKLVSMYADNEYYASNKQYTVTAIYKEADSDLPDRILRLPMCSHSSHYTSDNLHHDVFNIYF